MRLLPVLALVVLAAAGCVAPGPAEEDDPTRARATPPTGDLWPVPDAVSGLAPLGFLEFGGANDLAFRDHYAYVSSFGGGMMIVDLSDPKNPREVSRIDCNGKDIGVVDLPGPRRIVTLSEQRDDQCPGASPDGGIRLVDVTDPANPKVLSQVPLAYGSHTHTPYGDTGLLLNSAYDVPVIWAHHQAEIIDVTNPDAPKVAGTFAFPMSSKASGCHDILVEPERNRAICPGVHETMIWDMSDPLHPKILGTIDGAFIHHSAATARDGNLLILGDEFAGVLSPVCPNVQGKTPTGALFFYDITDPAKPKLVGQYAHPVENPARYCSAHNFGVVPGKDLVVGGFYGDGTLLVDFTDPANPKLVDQDKPDGGSAWASYHWRGLMVTGDTAHGVRVYGLEG